MKNSINCMKAECYKLIHSKLLLLHVGLPLLAIIVFGSYYSYSPMTEENKLYLFIQALAMAYPFLIAVIVSMSYESEVNAGKFQYILSAPMIITKIHVSKVISLMLFGLISCVVTVCGFGIVFFSMGYDSYSCIVYLQVSLLLFLTNIAGYFIQYMIAFTFGNGISLGFGVVWLILSALLYLGLGDVIWKYIPCCFGIRMCSYFIKLKTATNVNEVIMKDYKTGAISIIIITISCIILFGIWCVRWKGSRTESE